MANEWAVDPACIKDVADFGILQSHMGFYEGNFVCRFPSSWLPKAHAELENLSDLDKKRAVRYLQKMKSVLIKANREYDPVLEWKENALKQPPDAFFGVVTDDDEPSTNGVLPISKVDEFDWSVGSGVRGVFDVDTTISFMKPLLVSSSQLVLVDLYFDPWNSQSRDLFNRVLSTSFNAKCDEVSIFVDNNKSVLSSYSNLDLELPKIINERWSNKKRIRVFTHENRTIKDKQHLRYLFSELGGIRLDNGLRIEPGKACDHSWINKATHEDLLRTFVERPNSFMSRSSFTI